MCFQEALGKLQGVGGQSSFFFPLLRTTPCILIIMSLFFLGHLLGVGEVIASNPVYGPIICITHYFVNHHYNAEI